jgi:hypothetical protein
LPWLSKSILPPTWQHWPRSVPTSMIFCSVSSRSVLPASLKRDSRMTPLNGAKSAAVPSFGALPSFTDGVAGSSAGVFSGGE